MSRDGDRMRKALRRHVLPALAAMGFTGKASHFQRAGDAHLDLLSIQYWKYGGEFILEFARTQRGDLHTSWGDVVPEAKLEVAYVAPSSRARLVQSPRGGASGFGGFRFDAFGEDAAAYDALARDVAALLPQVDAWLERREAGSHVRPFDDRT